MALIKIKHNNQHNKVAPLVRNGGSRHTGLAALPHKNIHVVCLDVYMTTMSFLSLSLNAVTADYLITSGVKNMESKTVLSIPG